MSFINNTIQNIKTSLNNFYDTVTNKQTDYKERDVIQSKYSSMATKITQEYQDLVNSESYNKLSEVKKQNALFNLRFEDYKIGVKEELLKKANLLDNIVYNDPYCREPINNTYMFVAIVLIVFAILFAKIA
jgi:hypothetical protein